MAAAATTVAAVASSEDHFRPLFVAPIPRSPPLSFKYLPGPRMSHIEQLNTVRVMEDFKKGKAWLSEKYPELSRRIRTIPSDHPETVAVWVAAERVCRTEPLRRLLLGCDGNQLTLRDLYSRFQSRLPQQMTQSKFNVALILAACLNHYQCIADIIVDDTHPLSLYRRNNKQPIARQSAVPLAPSSTSMTMNPV